ncbi:MAG: sigma factor-like helix-turn-helix DNA-binding protein, partial [Opitutales bacterium]
EEVGRLRLMLERLPQAQKDSLSLALSKGLTQQEISEKLNMPLGTVKTSMRRGMQRLRQLMSHCYE